jgi:DNA polymerase eta
MTERVVSLLDMDCFYCQVEARDNPHTVGVPSAVVQYNLWKGGGIIAVNYEARERGVTRHMRGAEAKEACPEILLVTVPELRGKADLTKYRDAGKEVIEVLLEFGAIVERASVDEAYIDIGELADAQLRATGKIGSAMLPNTFVVGHEKDREAQLKAWLTENDNSGLSDNTRLSAGAVVMENIRKAVYEKTGFRCSAGVAHNKVLAKLACGLHKPNKQTVLPQLEVPGLFSKLKLSKLRGLGGKLGAMVSEEFNCNTMGDLSALGVARLRERLEEKTARWINDLSRGIDNDPVMDRDLPKSIGCSKTFVGPNMLEQKSGIERWFFQLSDELADRLNKDRKANGRIAKGITVGIGMNNDRGQVSRAGPLVAYDASKICRQAMSLIAKLNESTDPELWKPKLVNLSLSAGKFENEGSCGATMSVLECFAKRKEAAPTKSAEVNEDVQAAELVPTLDTYDPSILECLPSNMKASVEERVRLLKKIRTRETEGAVSTPEDTGEMSSENNSAVEREPCEKCGRLVSPFDLPEHLDFHLAKELQSEMSRSEVGVVRTVIMPGKRKRNEDEEKVAPGGKKQRDISSFFQKKQ